jgi:hypothetical protein
MIGKSYASGNGEHKWIPTRDMFESGTPADRTVNARADFLELGKCLDVDPMFEVRKVGNVFCRRLGTGLRLGALDLEALDGHPWNSERREHSNLAWWKAIRGSLNEKATQPKATC